MRSIEGEFAMHTDAEYTSLRLFRRLADEREICFRVPVLDPQGEKYRGRLSFVTWSLDQLKADEQCSLWDIRTCAHIFSQPIAVTLRMVVPSEIAPSTVGLTHWRSGVTMIPEGPWCYDGQMLSSWRTQHGLVHAVLANSFRQFQDSFGFQWSRAGEKFLDPGTKA